MESSDGHFLSAGMAQNASNVNHHFAVNEVNRTSVSRSITNLTDDMAQARDLHQEERVAQQALGEHPRNSTDTGSNYDKITKPTACKEDCEWKGDLKTASDYEAKIIHELSRCKAHSEVENVAIWTYKEDVNGQRQKKKAYQKKKQADESAKSEAVIYCRKFSKEYRSLFTNRPYTKQEMVVIPEKEYENVRRHGPTIIALVKGSRNKRAKVGLWRNLEILPKTRDYDCFDKYIPHIRLVARLNYQNARKRTAYNDLQKDLNKKDKRLEKLFVDDLPKLLPKLLKGVPPESELYKLLSSGDQIWPPTKSLHTRDPIIDGLKTTIVETVKTLGLSKKQTTNKQGIIFFRRKIEMFTNSYDVFYTHGKELRTLINKWLELKQEEGTEQPPAKIPRLEEPRDEQEVFGEVLSNIKKYTRPVKKSVPIQNILEDLLIELEEKLSSSDNEMPLTYEKLEKALLKDIRPTLRRFLLDPQQTVDDAVRPLAQLANNQFSWNLSSILLAALRDPLVWKRNIFDWLKKRRDYQLRFLLPGLDINLQTSQLKRNDHEAPNIVVDSEIEEMMDSLSDYFPGSPTGNQKKKCVELSIISPSISPLPANEIAVLMGNTAPPLECGDHSCSYTFDDTLCYNCVQCLSRLEVIASNFEKEYLAGNDDFPIMSPEVSNQEP